MRAETQTVRHMRLRGPSRGDVMRIVPEIEDALATTSWPQSGQGPARRAGTVLQIRRLALPRLGRGLGRFAIARLIEAQIAQGAVGFVTANALPAHQDWIVWPDRIEMLVGAALAATRKAQETQWWQALGVPETATPTTPEGFARAVLHFCDPAGPDLLPQALIRLLEVMEHPQIRRWVPAIARVWQQARPLEPIPDLAVDSVSITSPVLPVRGATLEPFAALPPETLRLIWVLAAALPAPVRTKLETLLRSGSLPVKTQLWLLSVCVSANFAALSQPRVQQRIANLWRGETLGVLSAPKVETVPLASARERRGKDEYLRSKQSKDEQKQSTVEGMGGAEAPLQILTPPEPQDAEMTRLGGGVALINMISHLGLPIADATVGSDYAVRLLHLFVQRLYPDDPMIALLPEADPEPTEWMQNAPLGVYVPTLTWFAPPHALVVRRISGQAGRCALCLPFGTGIVAILDARALGTLRAETPLRAGPVLQLSHEDLHNRICAGLGVLVARSLRKAAGVSWRAALGRSGYVTGSLTHLDVTLDLDDIRLAERRAGLDLSPGWVAWLGRIVSLHYEQFHKPAGHPVTHRGNPHE